MPQLLFSALALAGLLLGKLSGAQPPNIGGCNIFPSNSWWNTPIDTLPIHSMSDTWIDNIGRDSSLKGDFGSGLWDGYKIGIPYVVVPNSQPKVSINYIWYGSQSDAGPFPIPDSAPVEGGGDRHVLVVQSGACMLYELYAAKKVDSGWQAGSGAKWDLNSNAFRPLGWTSADAAGLPILPGLVRYEEILAGEIKHAIRFTAPTTTKQYIWPATHWASDVSDSRYPPMGARFRLKSDVGISQYSPTIQIILKAMKKYGLVLADNGSPWYMSGVPDERWDNDMLNEELQQIIGDDLVAVDVSGLMISASSGEAKTGTPTTAGPTSLRPTTKAPTTKAPTTKAPTSKAPSTKSPSTKSPVTLQPTALNSIPTTSSPTRRIPTKFPTRKKKRRTKRG